MCSSVEWTPGKLNWKLLSSGKVLSKSRNIHTFCKVWTSYMTNIFQDYEKDKMDLNVSIAF